MALTAVLTAKMFGDNERMRFAIGDFQGELVCWRIFPSALIPLIDISLRRIDDCLPGRFIKPHCFALPQNGMSTSAIAFADGFDLVSAESSARRKAKLMYFPF